MEWLPRAEVSLEDSCAPVVIIDTDLALSPFGLLITLRLAAAGAEVWLTPSLWRRLDEASIQGWPPMTKSEKTTAEQRAVIAQWERARLDLSSKRLFWVAETADESVLPKSVGGELIARFDTLIAALAARFDDLDEQLDDGAADTLVLSAALTDRPAAILTLHPSEREALGLVKAAAAAGANCQKLPAAGARRLTQLWWQPLLLRAGLMEFIITGGLKLACIRLIAPGAIFFNVEPEDEPAAGAWNWLGGAQVMWSAV